MMPMGTVNIQQAVTMVTKEGQSLLPVMQNKFSDNSLAKALPVDLILTIINNHRLLGPVYIRYCSSLVTIVTLNYLVRFH